MTQQLLGTLFDKSFNDLNQAKLTFQLRPKFAIEWARFTEYQLERFGTDFTVGESYRMEIIKENGFRRLIRAEKVLLKNCMKCERFMTDRVDATCGDCEDDEMKPMIEGVYELKKAKTKEFKYGKGLVLTFLNADKKPAVTCIYENNPFFDSCKELEIGKEYFLRGYITKESSAIFLFDLLQKVEEI